MFPMVVTKLKGPHRGRTKEYHLVRVVTNDGRWLIINRWGPAGKWGQMKVERHDFKSAGERAWDGKVDEKEKRGYDFSVAAKEVAADEDELKAKLGLQYWNNIGADNLAWLIPGVSTVGVKDPLELEEKPGGRWGRKERPPKLIPDPPDPLENATRENPKFGIF